MVYDLTNRPKKNGVTSLAKVANESMKWFKGFEKQERTRKETAEGFLAKGVNMTEKEIGYHLGYIQAKEEILGKTVNVDPWLKLGFYEVDGVRKVDYPDTL